ncbi:MAG TPA: lamin tail domain-containing protein, partial [Verrucomicrobiae bacterium]|nr:lamin tail domain-containing protein [Verrucomicrobiae bacterium]
MRVSFENAQRSGGVGSGATWEIDMKEVQAFGVPTNTVGLLNFTASPTQIVSSASTTLQWQENDLAQLNLYPNYGSVGSNTVVGGAGSLTLSPTNSTEYTLVGFSYSNNFPRQVTVEVNGQKLPPQISEFVADNQFSLEDGNGNASDWIELHNPNNTPLDMSGYYLSDDPAAQTKWQFPSGTIISPHGYFIVFADSASTNHIFDPSNYLHASFGLDDNGESLVLTGTNGTTVVDGITNFPAQMTDLAYGRTLDGQWAFLEPTPFAPNVATNYNGWLADLNFDHTRGWYTNAFTLVISNSNPGATVYWSTNGYEPANIYTGPLTVANTVGVRAAVKEAGYKSPRIKTHTYLFLNDI